ncbi:MAG TPA: hypothetical protein GXZ58_00095 [Bacilli bacterium]|nr:hypothetical protein [Bacteroidales bacterium]HHU18658.1 hypothetical protein [Bacilli bacterium]
MEESTVLNQILDTLNIFGQKVEQQFKTIDNRFNQINQRLDAVELRLDEMDKRFDAMDEKIDQGFANINTRLGRQEIKNDSMRVELIETQETTNFLLKKVTQHEKRFLELATSSS